MSLTTYINNLTWNSNAANASDWRAVTWGGPVGDKKFVAVSGTSVTGLSKVAVSTNGYEWSTTVDTPSTVFSTQCNKIIWDNVYQRFIAVGQGGNIIASSQNATGLSWLGFGGSGNGVGNINVAGYSVASNNKPLRLVAVGKGTNSIAYSDSNLPLLGTWTGVTLKTIFSDQGNAALWYGSKNVWIAVGQGTNTIATSPDGVTWTGRGSSVFSIAGYNLALSPTKALAFGEGTNTIAYSIDGLNWYGVTNSVFSVAAYACVWTGTLWHAVGKGTNTMAYSYDGIDWLGLGSTVFSVAGYGITYVSWAGIVVVGEGTNTIGYSTNGVSWYGLGTNLFTVAGYAVATNGLRLVAVGQGGNTIVYSNNGANWFPTGSNVFDDAGYSVTWSGTNWVALGRGTTNTAAYSPDGIVWTGLGNVLTSLGRGIYAKTPELVVVGSGTNNIAYSPNGVWYWGLNSLLSSLTFTTVNVVASNRSTSAPFWVAGGLTNPNPSMAYSTDGFIWSLTGNSVNNGNYAGVSYGNSLWVAAGQGSNTLGWSANGIGWTGLGATTFSTSGNAVAFSANSTTKWVAVGSGSTNNIASSSTGKSWTGAGLLVFTNGQGVANNNLVGAANRWVVVGSYGTNSIGYSNNGTSWTTTGKAVFTGDIPASSTTLTVTGISTGTITVGMEITGTGVAAGTRIVSGSGTTWTVNKSIGTSISTTITGVIFLTAGFGVAHNGKSDVATFTGEIAGTILTVSGTVTGTILPGMGLTGTGVLDNTVIVSGSGTSWVVNRSQTVNPAVSMTGDSGRWVAAGQGATSEGGNTLAYSNDGTLWNGLGNTVLTQQGRCVAYSTELGLWVAGGYSTPIPSFFSLAYSTDGVNWTGVPQSPYILAQVFGVSWNGAMFLASGTNNTSNISVVFAYSTDGINWFGYGGYSNTSNGANDVAYNPDHNTWVSVGNATSANSICYSPNGVNWIGLGISIFNTAGNGVTWKGAPVNKWVAVGATTNRFADSPDGLNWTGRGAGPFNTSANKVIYTSNQFVACGESTLFSLVTSPTGVNWTGVSNSRSLMTTGRGLNFDAVNNRVVATGSRANLIFSTNAYGVGFGGVDGAVFTGSITSDTLTVTSVLSGALSVGMVLTGNNVAPGTTITSGSGTSWIVNLTQNVASTQITGTRPDTVSFEGFITGTSLVVTSLVLGLVTLGMTVTGNGVLPGTVITSGTASPYTVNISQNTASFTGTINDGAGAAGNILTITSGTLTGTLVLGTTISGGTIAAGTYIVGGSGVNNTWIVSGAPQLVSSTTITTGAFTTTNCLFTGAISGTTLTVSALLSGVLVIGMRVQGAGVTDGTLITSGSGLVWTVSSSQTVSSTNLTGTFSQLLTGTSGLFVAGGAGTNCLAYSSTGTIWTGLGTVSPASPFTTLGNIAIYGTGAVGFGEFNATISGTTLTATLPTLSGTILPGMGVTGVGVTNGTVIVSGSGTTWTLNVSSTVPVAVTMRGSMSRWVGVGQGTNTLAISNDGITWTGFLTNIFGTIGYRVAYAPMVLFTGGTGGAASTVLTVTAATQGFLYSGMPISGAGVAAGTTIVNQLTGAAWTTGTYTMSTANTVTNGTALTGGHVWAAVGQTTNSIAYSLNNGASWTGVGINNLTSRGNTITFGGPTGQKKFVAGGTSAQTNGNCIAYSSDGVVWNGVLSSGNIFTAGCNGVAYGGAPGQEKFVAVGSGVNTFAYSFDGVTWTAAGGAVVSLIGYTVFWSSTKQIWLAGVDSPVGTRTPNGYAYSFDGIVWYGASATANYGSTFGCVGLAYGKNIFVSVQSSNAGYLSYANEEAVNSGGDFNWIQVGYNTIAVSNDGGSTWDGVPLSGINFQGQTVAYNGTKWIAGGATPFMYSDSIAKVWGSFNSSALYSVKWFPSISQFLLAMNGAGSPLVGRTYQSFIARSSDAVDWTWCDTGTINNIAFSDLSATPTTLVFGPFAEKPGAPPLIVCCGRATMSNSVNSTFVYRSNDGITWTRSIEPFLCSFILYVPFPVNPRFLVLSGNYITESTDGVSWTSKRIFADNMNATAAVWAPAPLGKVCVIGNGTNFPSYNSAVSSDGITWEYGTIPANSFTTLEWSPDLAIFCALLNTDRNQQDCLISGDGKNWYNANSLNTNNSFTGLVWSPELQLFCGMGFNTVARPYGYVSKLLQ